MNIKKLAHDFLHMFGIDIVKLKNQHNGLSQHLSTIIREKNIDCVIDVGANSGQYGKFLRQVVGFKGYIISFEPVSSVYQELEDNCKGDDKWLCYNLALGAESASHTINVYDSTVFSSFLEISEFAKEKWQSVNNKHTEKVRVERLDDVFIEIERNTTEIDNILLKIDTQGYEEQVLQGCEKLLDSLSAIQCELSFIPVYENSPEACYVQSMIKESGFYMSGIYPINQDDSLAIIECDSVFVKRSD